MIIKILGAIDLAAALAFLMLIFGVGVFTQYLLFCAVLLFVKGLFILMGDVLSAVDLVSAVLLILSISFALPSVLLWIPAFFLLAKGVVSFV
ncbi:MAG: hypothetical protein KJ718_05650 [Nanoarchaeota archaeon]|nr:hypothetical protein [Nanoarchaeota archaeon]MBU1052007.1 hypothetical protein [Nanoarchaeota archaeon]